MTNSLEGPAMPALEKPLERLVSALDSLADGKFPAPHVVRGPQASGRRVLLRALSREAEKRHQRVLIFDLLPFGHDTPAHVLLQIASHAPSGKSLDPLISIAAGWQDRCTAADEILDALPSCIFLIRFPAAALPVGERSDRQLQQESSDVLGLLTKPREKKLHVIAAQSWWKWPHPKTAPVVIELEASSDAAGFLADEAQWGSLFPHASRLFQIVGSHGRHLSPLQLRLGVALLAGGSSAKALREVLVRDATVRDLEPLLAEFLSKRPQVHEALVRVSRARTAVDAGVLETLAAAGEDWELISRCFLYPEDGGKLRFHDQLRWLVSDEEAGVETHARLRAYYESLDGAVDAKSGLKNVIPWLEKLHHANRADPEGDIEAWLKLSPPTREHFWEFGWSLSYVHHRYSAAARVFRELLSRVPNEEDNYAQHYLAFNLDSAGESPAEAEAYYRKAVNGDPTNAWWNARLVTFLTGRGKFDAALRAWHAALEVIDPDGQRSGGEWLPLNLHKHVIEAALESGDLRLGEATLRAVRAPADSLNIFRWLGSQLAAAREIRRLGEALFPANTNVMEWWNPRLLVPRPGEDFADWRAGRVLAIEPTSISVVLGHKPGDEPVIQYQLLSMAAWKAAANDVSPTVGDFFEAAMIDGKLRIVREKQLSEPVDEARLQSSLRFLSSAQWLK